MDYVISVRTYDRPYTFHEKTLKMLRKRGLTSRLFVFVGSDIGPYRDLNPDIVYIQCPKGIHKAIEAMCSHFPYGQPIMFMDDDLTDFQELDASGNFCDGDLNAAILEGFASGEIFKFSHHANRFWMKGLKHKAPRYGCVTGDCFGAWNKPELLNTPVGHGEEIWRTCQYFDAGITPVIFNHRVMINKGWGVTDGGMKSSGDRDDTKAICDVIYEHHKKWLLPPKYVEKVYMWNMSLLPAIKIKKMLLNR